MFQDCPVKSSSIWKTIVYEVMISLNTEKATSNIMNIYPGKTKKENCSLKSSNILLFLISNTKI